MEPDERDRPPTTGTSGSALVVYGTSEGHTREVATRLAERLVADGLTVRLVAAEDADGLPAQDVDAADLVVLGGSIHVGNYQPEVVDFATRHLDRLSSAPSAFFSVSLTSTEHTPEADAKVQTFIETFAERSGWHPAVIGLFGGALSYSQYGFVKRRLVRSIARKSGLGTDMSQDYDYTDWEAVEDFADSCARLLAERV